MFYIKRKFNASGGFKMPQESIDKRVYRNKLTIAIFKSDSHHLILVVTYLLKRNYLLN